MPKGGYQLIRIVPMADNTSYSKNNISWNKGVDYPEAYELSH